MRSAVVSAALSELPTPPREVSVATWANHPIIPDARPPRSLATPYCAPVIHAHKAAGPQPESQPPDAVRPFRLCADHVHERILSEDHVHAQRLGANETFNKPCHFRRQIVRLGFGVLQAHRALPVISTLNILPTKKLKNRGFKVCHCSFR